MIIVVGILGIAWFFASRLKMQKVFQWWNQRQIFHQHHQAEDIRDGILQELFALRRTLELLSSDNVEALSNGHRDCLKIVEKLHSSLEALSYDLSSPFVEESLPLAIQYLLKQWKLSKPELTFDLNLSLDESCNSLTTRQIIVTTLNELLKVVLANEFHELPVHINLRSKEKMNELSIQVTYPDKAKLISVLKSQDLHYLKETFQLLVSGTCSWRQNNLTVIWYLQWPSC